MRLDEYSIDDLHAMATAELEADAGAVGELHRLYAELRDRYIAAYVERREVAP